MPFGGGREGGEKDQKGMEKEEEERSKGKGERRRGRIEKGGEGGEGERRVIRDGEKAGNN